MLESIRVHCCVSFLSNTIYQFFVDFSHPLTTCSLGSSHFPEIRSKLPCHTSAMRAFEIYPKKADDSGGWRNSFWYLVVSKFKSTNKLLYSYTKINCNLDVLNRTLVFICFFFCLEQNCFVNFIIFIFLVGFLNEWTGA